VRTWGTRVTEGGRLLRRWVAARELVTMAIVAVLAAGVWTFVEVADAVREEETRGFDEKILLAMRNPADRSDPVGPPWVEETGRDLTALGGVTVLALFTFATAGYLLLERRPRALAFLLVAVVGGQLLSTTLKHGFARPRPDLVPHGAYVYTASFPSGHATMSAVTYLTLGALVARLLARRRTKLFVVACAIVFSALAGGSRVYLGVHWPSDVLAGWALGASWAAACWLAADAIDRRRRRTIRARGADPATEPEPPAPPPERSS
jgi:undecaprenyl-diphosphatase